MRIPLFKPVLRPEAIESVVQVLHSGWLGLGPKTAEFEQAFARYVGIPYCIGLNSCTAALHLALRLLDLPPGSEVITTPLTFVSTNHVILYERCRPVFADIQPDTGNLDASSAASRLTARTKAIVLVHYGGYPCDLDEFYDLAQNHGLAIIEDCAHACGAAYKGKKIGSQGDLHAFSFAAVKNLPMGTGGALTVRREDYAARAQRLRWLGISSSTFHRASEQVYRWAYEVPEVGYKYDMSDIQAAIGLAQLPFLDEDNGRRAGLVARYREQLANVPGIRFLNYQNDRTSSHHLCCILAEDRDALVKKLLAGGVDVSVHYRRNDQYPMYEEADLPNTDYFWRRVISLPLHLALSEEQVDHICLTIRRGW